MHKLEVKNTTIKLRKKGKSYSEILQVIDVSQSTLSLWLKDIPLPEIHKNRLAQRKLKGQMKGGLAKKMSRIARAEKLTASSRNEIHPFSLSEVKLLGTVLYWAEGAKQKENNVAQRVCFSNSDPQMIKIFRIWLDKICHIKENELIYELYIHKSADQEKAQEFWMKYLSLPTSSFKIYLKKHSVKTVRRNAGTGYNGQLRIVVRKSTDLNRKIAGWIEGVQTRFGEWCNGNTPVFGTGYSRFDS